MEKRKLNTFIEHGRMEFGDYILFQEYCQKKHDGKQYHFEVSRPIMAIYLGFFVADQTIGFNYIRWNNDNHSVWVSNEHVKNYRVVKEVDQIECHVEWNDYIDILGHWKNKPGWKEILKAYRKQNLKEKTNESEINWDEDEI